MFLDFASSFLFSLCFFCGHLLYSPSTPCNSFFGLAASSMCGLSAICPYATLPPRVPRDTLLFSVKLFFSSPLLSFLFTTKVFCDGLMQTQRELGVRGREEMKEEQRTSATCRVMAVEQKVSILICSPVEGW